MKRLFSGILGLDGLGKFVLGYLGFQRSVDSVTGRYFGEARYNVPTKGE